MGKRARVLNGVLSLSFSLGTGRLDSVDEVQPLLAWLHDLRRFLIREGYYSENLLGAI